MVSIVATLFTNGGRVGMVVIMHGNHDEPTNRRNTMNHDALEHEDDYGEDQMQHVASIPNVDNIQGFYFDNIQEHISRIK